MDKPLKLEQAKIIAQRYSSRIIPLKTNILDALGVTRALQETVQENNDAIQNICRPFLGSFDILLKSTLSEIEATLNGAGIEASNIKVTELGDFIGQLAGQVTELQTQISNAETQLEELI